jgi:hypothetical protein
MQIGPAAFVWAGNSWLVPGVFALCPESALLLACSLRFFGAEVFLNFSVPRVLRPAGRSRMPEHVFDIEARTSLHQQAHEIVASGACGLM